MVIEVVWVSCAMAENRCPVLVNSESRAAHCMLSKGAWNESLPRIGELLVGIGGRLATN